MKSIIHVNRKFIQQNLNDGQDRPVFTVKQGTKIRYGKEIEILGPSKIVYRKPLSCGARAYIETNSEILIHQETTYSEIERNYNG